MSPARLAAALQPSRLGRMRFREIWSYLLRQPMAFKVLLIYVFFEYVRPQGIYDVIRGWPLTSWSIILCAGFWVLDGMKLRKFTVADGLILLFTAIVLLSTITAYSPPHAFEDVGPSFLVWVLVFMLITVIVNSEDRFFVFTLFWMLWSFKMSQHGVRGFVERGFSFTSWGINCAPQFFQNSGECGIQMSIFVPISLYFYLGIKRYLTSWRKWMMLFIPISGAITIMASSSRGAQLALAAVLLWIVLRSRQRVKALFWTGILAGAMYALLPAEQMDRFRSMGTDDTSMSRRQYWADGIEIMNDYPVTGIGFDNWLVYYRTRYNPVGELPHNIFVEAGSELGYPGLLALVAMIIATFVLNRRTRVLALSLGSENGEFLWNMGHGLDGALIGFMVSGFFVTVLYYPFFWFNLAMTVALHTATRNRVAQYRRAVQATAAPPPGPPPGHTPGAFLPPGMRGLHAP
jgi:putative inorganic carbon (hco3(-)) transporter